MELRHDHDSTKRIKQPAKAKKSQSTPPTVDGSEQYLPDRLSYSDTERRGDELLWPKNDPKGRTSPITLEDQIKFPDLPDQQPVVQKDSASSVTKIIDASIYKTLAEADIADAEERAGAKTKILDTGLYEAVARADHLNQPKSPKQYVLDSELRSLTDFRKDIKNAALTAISPRPQFSEDDIPVYLKYTLGEFVQKSTLEKDDAYVLSEFLQKDPKNPDIWAFINRVAPKLPDAQILKSNLDLLTPDLIQALLVVGSTEKVVLNHDTGKAESVYIVAGATLGSGTVGLVSEVFYALANQWKLKPCLFKVANDSENKGVLPAFKDEIKIAKRLSQLKENNPSDSGEKNVLTPILVGEDFILMPRIANKKDQTVSLHHLLSSPNFRVQDFAKMLADSVKGNSFLLRHGIINVDFKPENVLEGLQGAVLIDLGGFVDKLEFAKDKGKIKWDTKNYTMYPVDKSHYSKYLGNNETAKKAGGTIPFTPLFNSAHLISLELDGQVAPGTVHKFLLMRIIERFFEKRYPQTKSRHGVNKKGQRQQFGDLGEVEKLYTNPIELSSNQLSGQAERELYALYRKLHPAHFHSFFFKEGNIDNEPDDYFISDREIAATLKKISKI